MQPGQSCTIKILNNGTDRCEPTLQAQISRLCTVCHSSCIFLSGYYIVKLISSILGQLRSLLARLGEV